MNDKKKKCFCGKCRRQDVKLYKVNGKLRCEDCLAKEYYVVEGEDEERFDIEIPTS